MTEEEWRTCNDPVVMLDFAQGRIGRRKLRLLGCVCVNLAWSLVGEPPPDAVREAELYADSRTKKESLRRAGGRAREERHGLDVSEAGRRPKWRALWPAEVAASENGFGSVIHEMIRLPVVGDEGPASAGLLRDIFNPFRPTPLNPAWRTPAVLELAEAAYALRETPSGVLDLGRLAVLSDALEEAGCYDAGNLEHLRGPEQHVRGCWALDLVLGRE